MTHLQDFRGVGYATGFCGRQASATEQCSFNHGEIDCPECVQTLDLCRVRARLLGYQIPMDTTLSTAPPDAETTIVVGRQPAPGEPVLHVPAEFSVPTSLFRRIMAAISRRLPWATNARERDQ